MRTFFAKNDENIKKHLQVCAAKEGITYTFDNGQIISSQNNFKNLGDVLYTFYFDSETTTGDSVFLDQKMFVVSYCQIYSFHPALNLDRIILFKSFQQTSEEIYNLRPLQRRPYPIF